MKTSLVKVVRRDFLAALNLRNEKMFGVGLRCRTEEKVAPYLPRPPLWLTENFLVLFGSFFREMIESPRAEAETAVRDFLRRLVGDGSRVWVGMFAGLEQVERDWERRDVSCRYENG